MWCYFLGGNLDRRTLNVDDIASYRGTAMCSPAQDPELVRSHGMCVYADTGRTEQIDGRIAQVFEHYGDWQSVNPPPLPDAVESRVEVSRSADRPDPAHWSYADLLQDVSVGNWVREHIPRFDGTVC